MSPASPDVVRVDTLMPLPRAEHQTPACGNCGQDTDCYDPGEVVCEDCNLTYVGDDLIPEFTDADDQPCRQPCDNPWHGSKDLGPYECHPCALPAGHYTSFHWTGCRRRTSEGAA